MSLRTLSPAAQALRRSLHCRRRYQRLPARSLSASSFKCQQPRTLNEEADGSKHARARQEDLGLPPNYQEQSGQHGLAFARAGPMYSRSKYDKVSLYKLHAPYEPPQLTNGDETGLRHRDPSLVRVPINGELCHLSPLILRDMCICGSCVDPSTKQKLFSTVDIPFNIQPTDLEYLDHGLSMSWTNDVPGHSKDHRTHLSFTYLDETSNSARGHAFNHDGGKVLWSEGLRTQNLPDLNYEAYMESDHLLYKALQKLRTHGLLFVTNVPESEGSVARIAERIGPLKHTFYGETWDVRSVPEANNVAFTAHDLGFHMDLLYMTQPPHLQLLHCIRSSSAGGASLFTDSYAAAARLYRDRRSAFRELCRTSVNYHYNNNGHYYCYQRPVIEVAMHGNESLRRFIREDFSSEVVDAGRNPGEVFSIQTHISSVAWAPPFQGPFTMTNRTMFSDLNSEVGAWHRAASSFNDLIQDTASIHERMMKPGECVIFDNRRILHARRAFEVGDAGKDRWLRGAYIDKDPYLSKLKVLEAQLGDMKSV